MGQQLEGVELPEDIASADYATQLAYVVSQKTMPPGFNDNDPGPGGAGGGPGDGGETGPTGGNGSGGAGEGSTGATGATGATASAPPEWEAKERGYLDQIDILNKRLGVPVNIEDPVLYRLSHIKKNKPEAFNAIAQMELFGNTSHIDLLIDEYISKNPEYKDERDFVKSFLENSYGLDASVPAELDPSDHTEEEVAARKSEIDNVKRKIKFGEMKMKGDANAIISRIKADFDAIELPKVEHKTEEQIATERDSATKSWTPVIDEVFKVVTSIPVVSLDKNKKPIEVMKYDIPADLIPEYKKELIAHCVKSGVPLTQEGVASVTSWFIRDFKLRNEAKITADLITKVRKMTEREIDAMYTNPSAITDHNTPPAGGGESPYEKSRREALEAEGVKA